MQRRHVVEDRLFRQVEPDHVRHERIDRLVVGDARADRIGERDAACPVRREQPRHAQHRVGPERERIEEIVVDATVDHVHALRPARRTHVHGVVLDEQIASLDKLDAHLLGEKRVLEVRRVVRAGRQHGDRGALLARRRNRMQVFEQQIRIVLHRPDRARREQLRKEPHHHLAVLEHVRHARRHAQVVFEHVVLAAIGAHDVDAGDVGIDAAGHVDADHLAPVLRIAEHALRRELRLRAGSPARDRCRAGTGSACARVARVPLRAAPIRPAGMMRGTRSNGIRRSVPACSPYTANVMPTRWKMRSASPRFCAMRSGGVRSSQSAKAR